MLGPQSGLRYGHLRRKRHVIYSAKRITKTIVILKISFSTPRRVLKVELELDAPNALPRPAPRTCRRIKKITAALRII